MLRLFAIVLALFLAPGVILAVEPVTVSLPLITLETGQNDTLDALIECPEAGCSAFGMTIEFDPQVIQVDTVEIGPFLGTQVLTVENVIDNETGQVRVAAAALGDMTEVGEPVLLRLTITPLNPGASQLRISQLDIGDLVGQPLETLGMDGGVIVTGDESDQPETKRTKLATEFSQTQPAESEQSLCLYRVQTGDTLSSIAIANGVTEEIILQLNELPDSDAIHVGQVLMIPASECQTETSAEQPRTPSRNPSG